MYNIYNMYNTVYIIFDIYFGVGTFFNLISNKTDVQHLNSQ